MDCYSAEKKITVEIDVPSFNTWVYLCTNRSFLITDLLSTDEIERLKSHKINFLLEGNKIWPRHPNKLCKHYWTKFGCRSQSCSKIHICRKMLLQQSGCTLKNCRYSHNISANDLHWKGFFLDYQVFKWLLVTADETVLPELCQSYSLKAKCPEPKCFRLHFCYKFLVGTCVERDRCNQVHSIQDRDWLLLKSFGFDPADNQKTLFTVKAAYKRHDPTLKPIFKQLVGVCRCYNQSSGCAEGEDCTFVHLCSAFVRGECHGSLCDLSHNISEKDFNILANQDSNYDSFEQITKTYKDLYRFELGVREGRTALKDKMPIICLFYNKHECENEENCPYIHICVRLANGKCEETCKLGKNHYFTAKDLEIMNSFGYDTTDPISCLQSWINDRMEESRLLTPMRKKQIRKDMEHVLQKPPAICRYYNTLKGCSRKCCEFVHICTKFVEGICNGESETCAQSHKLMAKDIQLIFLRASTQSNDPEHLLNLYINSLMPEKEQSLEAKRLPENQILEQCSNSSEGVRSEPFICYDFLKHGCRKQVDCTFIHPKTSNYFVWQYKARGSKAKWVDIDDSSGARLEELFSEPRNNKGSLAVSESEFTVDFNTMLLIENPQVEVRRVESTHEFKTEWKWYWQSDDGCFNEYGVLDSKGNITSVDSEFIETFFRASSISQNNVLHFEFNGEQGFKIVVITSANFLQKSPDGREARVIRRPKIRSTLELSSTTAPQFETPAVEENLCFFNSVNNQSNFVRF